VTYKYEKYITLKKNYFITLLKD